MKFKDHLLRCAACGAQFVFTISEQRQRAARGLSTDAPTFCRDCRGADVRLAEADAGAASEPDLDEGPDGAAPTRPGAPERRDAAARSPAGPAPRGGRERGRHAPRERSAGAPAARARRGVRSRRATVRQTELRIRHLGTVKWFDDDRGYGFIAQDSGDELFVHSSDILAKGPRVLVQGQSVEYEIEHTSKGLQAVDVVPLP